MVWIYDLNTSQKNRKWVKKCKMPERMCYFGYVLSADERYILLMGGYTTGKKLVKKMYVLDVESMKFIKTSNISSPASGIWLKINHNFVYKISENVCVSVPWMYEESMININIT